MRATLPASSAAAARAQSLGIRCSTRSTRRRRLRTGQLLWGIPKAAARKARDKSALPPRRWRTAPTMRVGVLGARPPRVGQTRTQKSGGVCWGRGVPPSPQGRDPGRDPARPSGGGGQSRVQRALTAGRRVWPGAARPAGRSQGYPEG